MKENENVKNIVLAIETSVQGGSISLLENEKQLGFWHGSESISKSEDILDELFKLLTKNKVEKRQIGRIVISRGPGSFTGARIGLAIVLGLKKSLNCKIYGVSVLEAIAFDKAKTNLSKRIIAAIPLGTGICVQQFEIGQKGQIDRATMPYLESSDRFINQVQVDSTSMFVMHEKLYKKVLAAIGATGNFCERIENIGENLAYLIGQIRDKKFITDTLQPIYIKQRN